MTLNMSSAMAIPSNLEPAGDEDFYAQILRLRDNVIAGQHAHIKLSSSAIEQLKASLTTLSSPSSQQQLLNGAAQNRHSFDANNQIPTDPYGYASAKSHASGLNPIFLEKSDSLVRAEAQLKRQRIERDLQTQVEQRKHSSREKDNTEGPSNVDVDGIYLSALERVAHVSGLKALDNSGRAGSSSFDENDYYSSLVESEWSSDDSQSKGSDKGTGAQTADHAHPENTYYNPSYGAASASKLAAAGPSVNEHNQFYTNDPAYEAEGEDDEYSPPDAAAFDTYREMNMQTTIPQDDDDDEYEPGDITQDSSTSYLGTQTSPNVPVIRNHLTHLAAPQPNRVSPLATAKGSNMELELVNGRPEMVHKNQPRMSSASPSGNGASAKKKNKKRKREKELQAKKAKKRNQNMQPTSPGYIKNEPTSPPPFGAFGEASQYTQRPSQYAPTEVNYASPFQYQLQQPYGAPQSGLRHEYAQPPPVAVPVASPRLHRPKQRDTQDLRRIASHQYAQRPSSPESGAYTPVTSNRSISYGQQPSTPQYSQHPQYPRAPSPPTAPEYRDQYASGRQTPVNMPPPEKRMVVDQHGNRYFAVGPAPEALRASVAPTDRRPMEQPYDRMPSRASTAYAQPGVSAKYDPADSRMAPPPPQAMEYVDANGYRIPQYSSRPAEPPRYAEQPPAPAYEQAPRYEMGYPAAREPTYAPPRAYSVRPDGNYPQQASIAPVQYARRDVAPPPVRAVSVMPDQQPAYGYAPQAVKYVDQYGREVFPREAPPQASEYRYQ